MRTLLAASVICVLISPFPRRRYGRHPGNPNTSPPEFYGLIPWHILPVAV
jgi:hypothetical protein